MAPISSPAGIVLFDRAHLLHGPGAEFVVAVPQLLGLSAGRVVPSQHILLDILFLPGGGVRQLLE